MTNKHKTMLVIFFGWVVSGVIIVIVSCSFLVDNEGRCFTKGVVLGAIFVVNGIAMLISRKYANFISCFSLSGHDPKYDIEDYKDE